MKLNSVLLLCVGFCVNQAVAADTKPTNGQSDNNYKSHPVDLFLFQPTKHPIGHWAPRDLKFEDVSFPSKDGTRIHGWLCAVKNPQAVILYAHGNAGNVTHRADRLRQLTSQLNVTVLVFDYRGYGKSEGRPTQDGMLADARAARSFLAKKTSTRETDLVLLGRSLGGAVVIQLASELAPRGLIVESTFSSVKDVAQHLQPNLAFLVKSDQLNSAEQIGKFTGPLFHSHGDADRLIPYSQGQELYDNSESHPKRHIRIRGGRHNDPLPVQYNGELSKFITALPKPKSESKR